MVSIPSQLTPNTGTKVPVAAGQLVVSAVNNLFFNITRKNILLVSNGVRSFTALLPPSNHAELIYKTSVEWDENNELLIDPMEVSESGNHCAILNPLLFNESADFVDSTNNNIFPERGDLFTSNGTKWVKKEYID